MYKHASPSFRSKIDKREQDVEKAEKTAMSMGEHDEQQAEK